MKKIFLDTNLLIYREDYSIVDDRVIDLIRILYDSNEYKIVIHPMTLEDLKKFKNRRKEKYSLVKLRFMIL